MKIEKIVKYNNINKITFSNIYFINNNKILFINFNLLRKNILVQTPIIKITKLDLKKSTIKIKFNSKIKKLFSFINNKILINAKKNSLKWFKINSKKIKKIEFKLLNDNLLIHKNCSYYFNKKKKKNI